MSGIEVGSAAQIYERIKFHKGIESILVVDNDNKPIRPVKGLAEDKIDEYAADIRMLTEKAASAVRDLDPGVCTRAFIHYISTNIQSTLNCVAVVVLEVVIVAIVVVPRSNSVVQ